MCNILAKNDMKLIHCVNLMRCNVKSRRAVRQFLTTEKSCVDDMSVPEKLRKPANQDRPKPDLYAKKVYSTVSTCDYATVCKVPARCSL